MPGKMDCHMFLELAMQNERSATLYAALADDIAELIAVGTLKPGEKLPSLRELRDKRGVSLSTVSEAFRVLEDRGLIEARPQSGFFVRRRVVAPPPPSRPSAEPVIVTVNRRLWDYLQVVRGHTRSFGYAVMAPEYFPNAQLRKLMNDALRKSPNLMSEYGGTRGMDVLRRQIARRSMEWGARMGTDDVLITAGGTEAINLALRAVTQPGDVVAVESPTYFGLLQLLESMGLQALEIPTDTERGISVEALDIATRNGGVAACVLIPSFGNPTGSLMSDDAKQRLVKLMSDRGVPVIEDDVYGEFYQGRERPRPLKAYDDTGNVLYVSSFTKVMAPGVRVGWISPGRYKAQIEVLKFINTCSNPLVLQATVAGLLESGGYDHHLRKLRKLCAEQLNRVTDGLARYFPEGTRWTQPQGGYLSWVELPVGADSTRILQKSVQEDITFAPGPLFSAGNDYQNYLRISCGEAWTPELDGKLRRLGELAKQQLDEGRAPVVHDVTREYAAG